MTLTVLTLILAGMTGVLVLLGQVWHRKALARFADLQYTLAVLARLQGKPDLAEQREARAAVTARAAWPFKPKRHAAYDTLVGVVAFDGSMTEDAFVEFTVRWRDASTGPNAYRITPVKRPRRDWWRRK
jgi:hypothetical protein